MQVNPSGKSEPVNGVNALTATRRSAPPAEEASFSRLDNLRLALDQTPAVRDTEVLRAKKLVGDVQYPPDETVRRIANLLAIHLSERP